MATQPLTISQSPLLPPATARPVQGGPAIESDGELRTTGYTTDVVPASRTDIQVPTSSAASGQPRGLLEIGNINLNGRPTIRNADGTHSSEFSTSFGDEKGREILVPTVVNGKFLTPDGKKPPAGSHAANGDYVPSAEEKAMFKRAQQHYEDTHEHMGIFSSPEAADEYAERAHASQRQLSPDAPPQYIAGAPAPLPHHSRSVQYPDGKVVAFPDALSDSQFAQAARSSWDFLKNEVSGVGSEVAGMAKGAATTVFPGQQQLLDSIKEVHPVYQAFKQGGLAAANAEAGRQADAHSMLKQRIQEFKDNPGAATGRLVTDAAMAIMPYAEPGEAVVAPAAKVSEVAEAVPKKVAGTAEGAQQDTALFAKAKAELGADASISDIAKRAQDMKVGTPLPKAAVAGRSVGAASINDLETKPDVPTFFSKAEQVINEKVSNNASGDQISALLKNNGVKPDEMKWAGLDEFLKDKPKVSKAELQEFIRENQIQLKDVDLGTPTRFTTQPNAEETAHAGEPIVDVIDPKNGLTRFTGSEASAKDYISELGQGVSSDEEKELGLLKERTATLGRL